MNLPFLSLIKTKICSLPAPLSGAVVRDATHAHPRHVPGDAHQPRQHEQGVLLAVAL